MDLRKSIEKLIEYLSNLLMGEKELQNENLPTQRVSSIDNLLRTNKTSNTSSLAGKKVAPEAGLPVRLTIIDADDEGNRSRVITGKVVDLSLQGMHVQTTAVESDSLNIIKDHTVAFKNRLDIEIDLPVGTVSIEGFAVWYRPSEDKINWSVGIYIKEMSGSDLELYEGFLTSIGAI
jgi:hypothetical protein